MDQGLPTTENRDAAERNPAGYWIECHEQVPVAPGVDTRCSVCGDWFTVEPDGLMAFVPDPVDEAVRAMRANGMTDEQVATRLQALELSA
jgi:hypothetical protein